MSMIEGESRFKDTFFSNPKKVRFFEYAVLYMCGLAIPRSLHYIVNAAWFAERFTKDGTSNADRETNENIMKGMGIGLIAFIVGISSPYLKSNLQHRWTRREFLGKLGVAGIGFAAGIFSNLTDDKQYKDK